MPRADYLFVLPWGVDHPGGVNSVVAELYDQLAQGGHHSPYILSTVWDAKSLRHDTIDGRQTAQLRVRNPLFLKGKIKDYIALLAYYPANLWRLRNALRGLQCRIINIHYVTGTALAFVLLKKLGLYRCTLIMSLHGTDLRRAEEGTPFFRWLWHFILRRADQVVCCSTGLRTSLLDLYPDLASSSQVIYNGVDVDALRSIATEPLETLQDNAVPRRFVITVASYIEAKGLDYLVRSFSDAIERIPDDLDLVIVGRDGDYFDTLTALLDKLGIASRVTLFKDRPRSDCIRLLARARFFVLPSRSEAFSVALLEAGGIGLPCIATDVRGVRELLDSDQVGMVVDVDDRAALSDRIIALANDDELAARLGSGLEARVGTVFTWSAAADAYRDLVAQFAIR